MNFLTKVTALLLPLLPCALAQAITSSSFYLVIEQPGATRDNTTLYSCPTAGHYSALCPDYLNPVMNRNSTTFHLNSTSIDPASEFLTVDVVDENMDYIESKALVFAYGPTTNVATPLFTSADVKEYTKLITATTVYFDDSEHLGIRSNYDDSVDPAVLGHWVAYYKWYICSIFDGDRNIETLSWVVGKYDTPQNPTCESVGIRRVWGGM